MPRDAAPGVLAASANVCKPCEEATVTILRRSLVRLATCGDAGWSMERYRGRSSRQRVRVDSSRRLRRATGGDRNDVPGAHFRPAAVSGAGRVAAVHRIVGRQQLDRSRACWFRVVRRTSDRVRLTDRQLPERGRVIEGRVAARRPQPRDRVDHSRTAQDRRTLQTQRSSPFGVRLQPDRACVIGQAATNAPARTIADGHAGC